MLPELPDGHTDERCVLSEEAVFRGDGDAGRLVVVFTGWTDDVQTEKFAFRDLCRRLGWRFILLRDPLRLAYLGGIPGRWDTYEKLLDGLREEMAGPGPENTVFLGESLGGFAALLFGHELKAGVVHGFGPITTLDLRDCLSGSGLFIGLRYYRRELAHLYRNALRHRRLFGLRRVLSADNGVTRYFVHANRGAPLDYGQARYLAGLPNIDILLHPGQGHLVAHHLARQRTLEAWVRSNGTELDLTDSRVGDADLDALAALRNVRRVHLKGTLATTQGVDRLRKMSPALAIDGI